MDISLLNKVIKQVLHSPFVTHTFSPTVVNGYTVVLCNLLPKTTHALKFTLCRIKLSKYFYCRKKRGTVTADDLLRIQLQLMESIQYSLTVTNNILINSVSYKCNKRLSDILQCWGIFVKSQYYRQACMLFCKFLGSPLKLLFKSTKCIRSSVMSIKTYRKELRLR